MSLENIIFDFILALVVSIITIVCFDYYNYCKSFSRLYCEIFTNYNKMNIKNIREEIDQMKKTHEENFQKSSDLKNWVGFRKKIDIWVIHDSSNEFKDDYQYLSTNEIKNFINNGYYVKCEKILDNMLEFYYYCESFSHSSQDCERFIFMNQNLRLSKRHEDEVVYSIDQYNSNLNEQIEKIWAEYQYHNKKIESHYKRFIDSFEDIKPYLSKYFIMKYCKKGIIQSFFCKFINILVF